MPDAYIRSTAKVMELANWHIFQVLTKRSERLREMLNTTLRSAAEHAHIWWGVSVEDRLHGLPRIEHLRSAPAKMRFLSIEPLLEDLGRLDLTGIHWVIVGEESGAGARPMEKAWVIAIRDQCAAAKVPFFFKQWGGVRKRKAGRELDGDLSDEFPDTDRAAFPGRSQRRELAATVEDWSKQTEPVS